MKLFVSKKKNSGRIEVNPTKTIVTYTINAVHYTSTFDISVPQSEKDAFAYSFIQATAKKLDISPENITVLDVIDGSTIVDSVVYVHAGSSVTIDAIETKILNSSIIVTHNGEDVGATVSNLKTGFVSIMGEKPQKLAEPHQTTARNISADSIELIWTDEDNGDATVLKYLIFKNNILIGEVSADVFTYTVVGLENNIHYTFNVRKETNLTNVDSIVSITFPNNPFPQITERNIYAYESDILMTFKWTKGVSDNLSQTYSIEYSSDLVNWTEYDSFEYVIGDVGTVSVPDKLNVFRLVEYPRTLKLVSPVSETQAIWLPNIHLKGLVANTDYYVRLKQVEQGGTSTYYSPVESIGQTLANTDLPTSVLIELSDILHNQSEHFIAEIKLLDSNENLIPYEATYTNNAHRSGSSRLYNINDGTWYPVGWTNVDGYPGVNLGDKIILTLTDPTSIVKSVKIYRGSTQWRYDLNVNIGWTVTYTGVPVVLDAFSKYNWNNAVSEEAIPPPNQAFFWLDDLDALWGQMEAAGLVQIASLPGEIPFLQITEQNIYAHESDILMTFKWTKVVSDYFSQTYSIEYSSDLVNWTEYDSFEYVIGDVETVSVPDALNVFRSVEYPRTLKLVSPVSETQAIWLPNIRLKGLLANTDYYVRLKQVEQGGTYTWLNTSRPTTTYYSPVEPIGQTLANTDLPTSVVIELSDILHNQSEHFIAEIKLLDSNENLIPYEATYTNNAHRGGNGRLYNINDGTWYPGGWINVGGYPGVNLGDKIILTLTDPTSIVKSVKIYRGSTEWRYELNINIGWTVTYTGVPVVLDAYLSWQWWMAVGEEAIPPHNQVKFWLSDTESLTRLDALWGQMEAAGLVQIANFPSGNNPVENENGYEDPTLLYHWDFSRSALLYNKEIVSDGDSSLDFIEMDTNLTGLFRPQVSDHFGNKGIDIGNPAAYFKTPDGYKSYGGNIGIGVVAPTVASTFPKENFTIQFTFSIKDDYTIHTNRISDLRPSFAIPFYKYGTSFGSSISDSENPSGLTAGFSSKDSKFSSRQMLYMHDENGVVDPPTGSINIPNKEDFKQLFNHTVSTMGPYPLYVSRESQTLTICVERDDSNELSYNLYIDNVLVFTESLGNNDNLKLHYNDTVPFIAINEVGEAFATSALVMKSIKIFDRVLTTDELPLPSPNIEQFNYHYVSDDAHTYNKTNVTLANNAGLYDPSSNEMNSVTFIADRNYFNNKYNTTSHLTNLHNDDFWIEYEMELKDSSSIFAMQVFNFSTNVGYDGIDYFQLQYEGICFGSVNGVLTYKCGSTLVSTSTTVPLDTKLFYSVFVDQTKCVFYYNKTQTAEVLKTDDSSFWDNVNNTGYYFGLINLNATTNRAHFLVRTSSVDLGTQSNDVVFQTVFNSSLYDTMRYN